MRTIRYFWHGFIHRGTTFMYLQYSRSHLIYDLLPNVWNTSYTISASIFFGIPYCPSYSEDKLISCVVPGPTQWFFHFGEDHSCGLGVTSLPLTQRTRVRSPVGSISWLSFLRSFPSTVLQMSGYLGHICPWLSYGHHISSIPSVYGRRLSLNIAVLHGRLKITNKNNKFGIEILIAWTQEKTTTLGGAEPHNSSWQCKKSHRCCCHRPLAPLTMGDSGTSTVRTRVHAITISSPKSKSHCVGHRTTQEINLSVLQSGHTKHQQRWARWWCTTPSKQLKKCDK